MRNQSGPQVVLIQTSGNQAYIFSTNKRREIVGASDLVHRVSTQWLDAALVTSPIPGEDILVRASGKILLIAPGSDVAREIITNVTTRALEEAPGLDVCALFLDYDRNDSRAGAEAIKRVHREFQFARSLRPSPEQRFLRLPIVADCDASGYPAVCMYSDESSQGSAERGQGAGHAGRHSQTANAKSRPRSAASLAKLKAVDTKESSLDRLLNLASSTANAREVWKTLEYLDTNRFQKEVQKELTDQERAAPSSARSREVDWVAVIHIDGNGLGELFSFIEPADYARKVRDVSKAVKEVTHEAFRLACEPLAQSAGGQPGILPLVVGGDDVTVLCRGEDALKFVEDFLLAFERESGKQEIIRTLLKEHSIAPGHLSACAGVAIVKPHFPFSTAYRLCEHLTKSAKRVKKIVRAGERAVPCSALDFHILYDSADVDLKRIRAGLGVATQPKKGPQLIARPYVVSSLDELASVVPKEAAQWIERHSWDALKRRAAALADGDSVNRALPRSQQQALRAALFLGVSIANQRAKDLRDRYLDRSFTALEFGAAQDLFVRAFGAEEEDCEHLTGFLDALEAADFLSFT